jgi:chromosome segregation ATPase
VVLRVPAAKLDEAMRELKALGTVERAETTIEDVTTQRVDLDARIKALQTSVDRLLAIMRDAKDPDALIKAEDALSERQAELDSLRAQREALGDRIDYSTVDVTFVADTVGGPAPEAYQGFLGQIERGWDALVSVVGNLVLLFGLLLPWLGVLAVAGGIGYGVIRLVRARRP